MPAGVLAAGSGGPAAHVAYALAGLQGNDVIVQKITPDPLPADGDGDGLPDTWETAFGLTWGSSRRRPSPRSWNPIGR